MKFEQFRNLIEERKELTRVKVDSKGFSRIKEIDQILCFEKWSRYKDVSIGTYLGVMEDYVSNFFYIGSENIVKILKRFFDKDDKISCDIYDGAIFVEVQQMSNTKVYSLGENNEILFCLYTRGLEDWEKLLMDYPDLREYMWENLKSLKQQEKRSQVSLIQKMLKEKNQEQEVLENPELREAKIAEIRKEKRELENMLSLVEKSFNEIEI